MSDDRTVFQPKAPSQGSVAPGRLLNGMFQIERLIAEGGMGEVYKGMAVASGDAVAIKLVRPDLASDPEVMALFKREAQVLHDLLHDAIVRYYVFSLEPELQRYYIAMEFVDGQSLQNRLASGPLTGAEARILLRRIGGALDLAHGRGIVHRDISSDNIILPGGDVKRAKIVDFGIAKAARPGEGTIIGGGLAGKYKYMSPEQLGLFGGEVTPKSDIYSFGLVIAEALRGRPIDMGGSQVEVIEKRRTVPDLAGVDPTLQPLVAAMLAPNPADRPANMADIAAWGEGTMIRPGEPPPKATKPAPAKNGDSKRGGSGAAIGAAAVVALLAAGGGVYLLRDSLGLGGGGATVPVVTQPPLPTLTPSPVVTASPPPSPVVVESPTATPTPSPDANETAQRLLDEMKPAATEAEATLAPATAGAPYRAELPAFTDPSGKGLSLQISPAPPAGLAFKDLGGGRSEISGTPAGPGAANLDVVAVNHAKKSAHMKVALAVNPRPPTPKPSPPKPPQPPQAVVDLEPALAGAAYVAGLPPFRADGAMTLKAGPGLPEGLTLNDLGNGLSQLAGAPTKPGKYAFDVIAAGAGGEGRMKVRVEIKAAPLETPKPSPTADVAAVETPQATASDFLRDYAAPPCFAARAVEADGRAVAALGADSAAFAQFASAFRQKVGADPDLRSSEVRKSQCAAVDFLRAASASPKGPPRLSLDATEVSGTRPVAGKVEGLAGRALLVAVVDDDGTVFVVPSQVAPDGDSATFGRSFGVNDAATFGKAELVLAIAADRPPAAKLEGAPSQTALPKLAAELKDAAPGAAAAVFRFVK
jgi:serine/threonine-protein kinase